jgi:spoIIIJ-associated protein
MRSRRTRGKYERIIPKPSLVIEVAAPQEQQSYSLERARPSRARERVRYEASEEDNKAFISAVQAFMESTGIEFEARYEHAEYQRAFIEVDSGEAGALIGKRGASIEAMETLLARMTSHQVNRGVPVQVDVNSYRERHEEELRDDALARAKRVLETGADDPLPPMGARDRRVVHLALEKMDGVETFSVGDGPSKHIVIHRSDEADKE